MGDMSFKQAKELVERMEFSEISLKKSSDNLEKSTVNFGKVLKQQEDVLNRLPKADKKISILYIILAINVGFIAGLFVGKYIL